MVSLDEFEAQMVDSRLFSRLFIIRLTEKYSEADVKGIIHKRSFGSNIGIEVLAL